MNDGAENIMSHESFVDLFKLSIETNIARTTDFDAVIRNFAEKGQESSFVE
jgi:hypothetical protein